MQGFYDRFSTAAERRGGEPAVEVQRHDGLESYSYAELRRMAHAAAARLAARGIGHGDRCAILGENGAHWCAVFLGVQHLGAVAVPLDTAYEVGQVTRLLDDSGATCVLASDRFLPTAVAARRSFNGSVAGFAFGGAEAPEVDGDGFERIDLEAAMRDDADSAPPPGLRERDAPSLILYTSGTTHDPKGVVLTHGNVAAELDAIVAAVRMDERDVVLGVLPLFHALAQVANLALPLSLGARVVFLESMATGELMRAFAERRITAFCCVPQFFYLIHQRVFERVASAGWLLRTVFRLQLGIAGVLRERLGFNLGRRLFKRVHRALGPDMRLLVTGGSRFDPGIGRDLYRLGFNILQAYGLTETTGGATVLRPGDRHVSSVGQPLPSVEVKILPSELAADGAGEVALRGPVITPGYHNRDDVNAESFVDGWFRTGDLGYLDDAGRLYITGRAKEVIVLSSGKNIHPEEIEAHYLKSEFIKELCVMARTRPDEPSAERLHAIVVPDMDQLKSRKIVNLGEIIRWEIETISAQLPSHKRILGYDVALEDLPRTTTLKLKRFEIEQRYAELKAGSDATLPTSTVPVDDGDWAADPHVDAALAIIRRSTSAPDVVHSSANLDLDLGLDSMERVELLTSLQARFGVEVSDELAQRLYTVRELVEAVRPDAGAAAGDASSAEDPWKGLLEGSSLADPEVEATLARNTLSSVVIFLGLRVIYVVAWLLLGFRVSGRERLPKSGPFLICPNHQTYLDGPLATCALPYRIVRDIFYVGSSEYFESSFMRRFARFIRLVPVDPDSNLVRAMRAGALGLRRNGVLVLFPEGERSIDTDIKAFKKGAAILSRNVDVAVVPAAFQDAFHFWPRTGGLVWSKLLPFSGARIRLIFGDPLRPAEENGDGVAGYDALTDRIRSAVSRLLRNSL